MAITSDEIQAIRDELKVHGSTIMEVGENRLALILYPNVGITDERGVLVALENHGSLFWNFDRKLNRFRLVSAGFSDIIAASLADILNQVFGASEQQNRIGYDIERKQ